MNKKAHEIVKNVVEENIIDFKKTTSEAIYEKLNNLLKSEYAHVAKKMFNEAANSSIQQGSEETFDSADEIVMQSPGGPSRGEGAPPPNPGPEPKEPTKPDRKKEPWDKMTDDEFKKAMEEYKKAYQKWYRAYERWTRMMEEYRAWQRRQRRGRS